MVPSTLAPSKDGSPEVMRLLMTMQVIAPVTWTVRAFVEPKDIRQLLLHFLKKPTVLLKAIKFLMLGGASPSLIVNKLEGTEE